MSQIQLHLRIEPATLSLKSYGLQPSKLAVKDQIFVTLTIRESQAFPPSLTPLFRIEIQGVALAA